MMKRRVSHLAEKAGITPDEALSRLQAAGYRVKTVSDQLSRHTVDRALAALGYAPKGATYDPQMQNVGVILDRDRVMRAKPEKLDGEVDRSNLLQPPKRRRDRQQTARYLSTSYVLEIHNALVAMFAQEDDPISPPGPKDMGLLESAAHRPQTSLGDIEKYSTIYAKGAALFHSMVKNHPFHNGNKRTALVALLVFLELNGLLVSTSDNDLFNFVIDTAKSDSTSGGGADEEVNRIEGWLRDHSTRIVDQVGAMKVRDFIDAVNSAGGRCRESADRRSWIIWGLNDDSVTFNKVTTELAGNVVRKYLQKLGLSHGQSGIHFGEFQEGLAVDQRLMRKFRVVLKQLAHS